MTDGVGHKSVLAIINNIFYIFSRLPFIISKQMSVLIFFCYFPFPSFHGVANRFGMEVHLLRGIAKAILARSEILASRNQKRFSQFFQSFMTNSNFVSEIRATVSQAAAPCIIQPSCPNFAFPI